MCLAQKSAAGATEASIRQYARKMYSCVNIRPYVQGNMVQMLHSKLKFRKVVASCVELI